MSSACHFPFACIYGDLTFQNQHKHTHIAYTDSYTLTESFSFEYLCSSVADWWITYNVQRQCNAAANWGPSRWILSRPQCENVTEKSLHCAARISPVCFMRHTLHIQSHTLTHRMWLYMECVFVCSCRCVFVCACRDVAQFTGAIYHDRVISVYLLFHQLCPFELKDLILKYKDQCF